jgi:hypothetical protein
MGKPAPTRVTFTTADIYPHTSAALGLWTEQYSLAICLSGSSSHLQFVNDLREKREEADPKPTAIHPAAAAKVDTEKPRGNLSTWPKHFPN